jgi:para-nitrobenzyl esterase
VSHPVIEPHALPVAPYDALTSRSHNDVPLLVGFNAEEALAFIDPSSVKAESFAADIQRRFGALPAPLLDAYPHVTDTQARQARLDLERDLRFGWDMWAWARSQVQSGRSPVYFYYFKQQPPFPKGSVHDGWVASHFAELWYMFDHLNQDPWPWSAADRQLATLMARYWTNFAKNGDPNGEGLPRWPSFDGDATVLHLSDSVTAGRLPNADSLRVFDAVYDSLRGKPLGGSQ